MGKANGRNRKINRERMFLGEVRIWGTNKERKRR
jgi:hypothetical protein